MEHQFTGPAFTIGIEEELMILDAESLELVNAIESLLEAAPAGEIKPELMESVLEIVDRPVREHGQAGEQLRALRAQVARRRRAKGLNDRLRRDAPVRDVGGPADRRAAALPRPDSALRSLPVRS